MGKKAKRKKSIKKAQEVLIDFDSWFWFQVKEKKFRPEQSKELKVFFDSKGLKDKESRQKFDEIMKLY